MLWYLCRQVLVPGRQDLMTVYFSNFKNLHVITKNIRCHLERRHVDNLDIGIFKGENSTQLCVFSLQELFHRDSLELLN